MELDLHESGNYLYNLPIEVKFDEKVISESLLKSKMNEIYKTCILGEDVKRILKRYKRDNYAKKIWNGSALGPLSSSCSSEILDLITYSEKKITEEYLNQIIKGFHNSNAETVKMVYRNTPLGYICKNAQLYDVEKETFEKLGFNLDCNE